VPIPVARPDGGERTATGSPGAEKPETEQPVATSGSIVPSSYFKDSKGLVSADLFKEHQDLIRKFASNPKLAKSQKALELGLAFFVKNKDGIPKECGGAKPGEKITNREWMVITDYTKPLDEHRQFYLNLVTGEVKSAAAAHGYGSNKNCPEEHLFKCKRKGKIVEKCKIPAKIGDVPESGQSSSGYYLSDKGYASGQGTFRNGTPKYKNGEINAINLEGVLSENKNASYRKIVFHRASYVQEGTVNECSSSAGCPSTNPKIFEEMKDKLMKGALFYSHTIKEDKEKEPKC